MHIPMEDGELIAELESMTDVQRLERLLAVLAISKKTELWMLKSIEAEQSGAKCAPLSLTSVELTAIGQDPISIYENLYRYFWITKRSGDSLRIAGREAPERRL